MLSTMRFLDGKRVALLACGSFNPPTLMHLRMFECARDFLQHNYRCTVLEGIISPVADFFDKPDLIPATHRVAMAELAVQGSNWIRADEWESVQGQWTRTVSVLKHHKESLDKKYNYGGVRLMLLCGGDVVDSFPRVLANGSKLWQPNDIAEIIHDYGLVVLTRQNTNPMETLRKMTFLNEDLLSKVILFSDEVMPNDVSATRLRSAIRRGDSIKYCAPDKVVDYIESNLLYCVIPEPHPVPEPAADPADIDESED